MSDINQSLIEIVSGIQEAEAKILMQHHEKVAAQHQATKDRATTILKREEIKEATDRLKLSRVELAKQQVNLMTEELKLVSVKEEISKMQLQSRESKEKNIEDLKAQSQSVDELVKTVMNFHQKVRLDNPVFSSAVESQKRELHQLQLSLKSLKCEIQVLEEDKPDVESMEASIREYQEEINNLRKGGASWENDINHIRHLIDGEKIQIDEAADAHQRIIRQKNLEIKNVDDEADCLQGTLAHMRQELENAKKKRKSLMEGGPSHQFTSQSTTPSQPQPSRGQPVGSSGQFRIPKLASTRGMPHQGRNYQETLPQAESYESQISEADSYQIPAMDNRRFHEIYGLEKKSQGPYYQRGICQEPHYQKTLFETYLEQRSRFNGCRKGAQVGDSFRQRGHHTSWQHGGGSKRSTYWEQDKDQDRGEYMVEDFSGSDYLLSSSRAQTTPSTPRTFTRNPAPPTPQENKDQSPLPLHRLGGFICIPTSMSSDEEEEEREGIQEPENTGGDTASKMKAGVSDNKSYAITSAFKAHSSVSVACPSTSSGTNFVPVAKSPLPLHRLGGFMNIPTSMSSDEEEEREGIQEPGNTGGGDTASKMKAGVSDNKSYAITSAFKAHSSVSVACPSTSSGTNFVPVGKSHHIRYKRTVVVHEDEGEFQSSPKSPKFDHS